jgi:hypothetical protein
MSRNFPPISIQSDDETAKLLFQFIFRTRKDPKDYSLHDTNGSVDESQILPRLAMLVFELGIDHDDVQILVDEQHNEGSTPAT